MRKAKKSKWRYDAPTPEQEAALLAAVQLGNAARERLQQHTVRMEDIAEAKRDAAAGRQARESLLLAYLPFLTMLARRYSSSDMLVDDLIQECSVILLKSMDRYRGGALDLPSVIAVQVKWAMQKILLQRDAVRLPDNIVSAIRKVTTVERCLELSMGRAHVEDIADEMAISPAAVRMLRYYATAGRALSLNAPAFDSPDDPMQDHLPVLDSPTPEEQAERKDLRERVREVLSTLEPAEESAIRLRFGFVGGEVYSAEETAEELTIPLDEEQRIEIRAMRKLRHPSRSALLRDYL